MAKKKKSKTQSSNFGYSIELTGLTLILIGIIGFGFGFIGTLIKKFTMFLAGTYWFILLFIVLYVGIYMLFNRKLPKFLDTKFIGLYILLCTILASNHFGILNNIDSTGEIFKVTYDNFLQRINTFDSNNALNSSGTSTIIIGGGLIGATVISALHILAGVIGSKIILFVLTLFGFILLLDLNLSEMLNGFFENLKNALTEEDDKPKKEKKKKEKPEAEKNEQVESFDYDNSEDLKPIKQEKPKLFDPIKEPEDEDEDIIISSIDDIKNPSKKELLTDIIEEKDNFKIPPKETFDPFDENTNEFKPAPTLAQTQATAPAPIPAPTPANATAIDEERAGIYKLPHMSILAQPKKVDNSEVEKIIRSKSKLLETVMNDFGIKGKVVKTHIGPAVTQYEITVPQGTKVNKISSINKEIALAMAAKDVRIEAPIPGKSTIGIEIPNGSISAVSFREVLEGGNLKHDNKLFVALGKDLMGQCIIEDLTKMPHLLVAGSTGSGKSVCINTMLQSLLMRYTPKDVKLVMVDPKKVELTNYNGIPHLLCPVISDPKKASLTLQKIVVEMEKRYELFSEKEVKNIESYNNWVIKQNEQMPDLNLPKMPFILVIIDELADLMLVASKEVEESIMRITAMARAAGIHLIVATQRPSTDVITGLIKNNIPSRIAFAVSSSIDSRTILDATGAEKLLGKGDMLYLPMGESATRRIQGCYVSDDEIKDVITHCKNQAEARYDEEFSNANPTNTTSGSSNSEGDDDVMYNEVVEFAYETGKISASLIQRRFRFGYNRAARLIDLLESRGIVGPQNGSKPREVIPENNPNI